MLERFETTIAPIPEEESDGKWDYLVTVKRKADGITESLKVSGGYQVAENYARQMMREFKSDERSEQ